MKVLAISLSFCEYGMKDKPGDMLRNANIDLVVNTTGKKYLERDLLPIIDEFDGVITGADEITARVIEKGKNLKIIAKNGVGYDNIDVQSATQHHIYVTTTPGAVEQTVADTTMGLMVDLARNITKGDRSIRKGGWERLRGTEVWEKKLGIIGLGSIGKNVAHRAKGFNMDVYAYDPMIDLDYCSKNGITSVGLQDIFTTCDYITIHCLLTESTRHLVNEEMLGLMKPGSFLVNTSRGGVIDEKALYDALKNQKIAGTALDVFETEPLPKDSPLFELDNILLIPHIAGYSSDVTLKAGVMVAESVIAALEGEVPPHLLNKEVVK